VAMIEPEVVSTIRLMALVVFLLLFAFPSHVTFAQAAQATSADGKHSAAAAFDEGQSAQQRGDLTSAVKFYTTAIVADPALFQAYYQRATALIGLGRETE